MLNKLSFIIGILLLTGCGGSSSPVPRSSSSPDPDKFASLRTTVQSQLTSSNAPAVSVAIMKEGEVVFAEAYGKKTHNGGEDVDSETLFQLGSTTKMFTAVATLQLVNENVLTLDQSLPSALPTLALSAEHAAWSDISIQHMLTHQGGFTDYVDWAPETSLMEHALNNYPNEGGQMNPAGKFFNYSNPNWSYLGAILEYQSGMPYEQTMKEKVFVPLGMARTTMTYQDVKDDGNYALGVGQTVINNEAVTLKADTLEQISQPTFGKPAGGYTWSTASELVKMGDFLINGKADVLPTALQQQLTSAQVSLQMGMNVDYGYGLFLRDGINVNNAYYPVEVWEHGGNTLAYTNMLYVFPEQNVTIAIMSSGQSTDFSTSMLAAFRAVSDLPASTTRPVMPVATELFARHVGDYQTDDVHVEVTDTSGALMVNLPEFNEAQLSYDPELQPIAASAFFFTLDGEQVDITFILDEEDGVSMYIRNREFVAIRTDSSVTAFKKTSQLSKKQRMPKLN
jgi:CubicO group peptidase (beta-lactamase class C family)